MEAGLSVIVVEPAVTATKTYNLIKYNIKIVKS